MIEFSDEGLPLAQTRGGVRPWLFALALALREDRLPYCVIAVYVIATTILAWVFGTQEPTTLLLQLLLWLKTASTCVGLCILAVDLHGAIRANPHAPLAGLAQRLRARLTPGIVRPISMILALALFLGTFTTAKNMLPVFSDFTWDQKLADLDAWLHGGVDPWRLQQPALGHHAITVLLQFCYLPIWLLLTCGAPIWAVVSPRLAGSRTRFVTTYLLTWILLGNVLAATFMSAGPVYFGQVTGDFERFRPLMTYHAFTSGMANSSYDVQQYLWRLHSGGLAQFGSGISAFPSLHVAMATLFAILGSLMGPKAFAAALAFLVLIMATSVHLGWHYAIDGYAAVFLTVGLWCALKPLDRRVREKVEA